MINNYLETQIKENFPYEPTFEQEMALKSLAAFLLSSRNDAVFVLRGYAGTGKTSLVGALVRTLDKLQQKSVLLAPTGRAAKVFSAYAGHPAFTIHKKIYRQQSFSNETDNFSVNDNLTAHTLYIVDEASMISNEGLSGAAFGTGRLLDDLIQFVYSGIGCRLLLLGDTAQLPPVGEEQSPALYSEALKGYGLEVMEADLTQVVRQVQDSGILWNATRLRQLIVEEACGSLPKIRGAGFAVVAKDNYYWTEKCKEMDFIANGEIAVLRRMRRTRELYGFRFAEVLLAFPDYGDLELEVSLLLDTLHTDAPALPKADGDRLFYAVLEDYADISTKRERMKKMKADPHYNALQVKYAYAVTCHKAQGGQWKNVFLDQGYMSDEYLTPDYFRWLYTAFTRATGTLYLVNYPNEQID